MPTIPIFAESFRFSRLISALRFWKSKFRKITILQAKMVPDKIKDVTLTYTPVLRTFYVAVDKYTWTPVVNNWLVCALFFIWKGTPQLVKKLPDWEPNSSFENMAASPAKKHKTLQKFIPEYTNFWPVLKPSKIGNYHAFCEVCKTGFSISHGGRDDCHRHVSTKKNMKFAKLKIENKHEVQLSAMLLGGRMRVPC